MMSGRGTMFLSAVLKVHIDRSYLSASSDLHPDSRDFLLCNSTFNSLIVKLLYFDILINLLSRNESYIKPEAHAARATPGDCGAEDPHWLKNVGS